MAGWPPIGKVAARSAYDMFSWYKYLIVSLFFPILVFLEWESFSDCARKGAGQCVLHRQS